MTVDNFNKVDVLESQNNTVYNVGALESTVEYPVEITESNRELQRVAAVTGISEIKRVRGGLNATMKKCAEMLVTRDVNRMTNDEIAKELGIDRSTLYRWKQRADFNDYMNALSDEFNRAHLSEAYIQLRNILQYGKPHEKLKAIEIMLKTQGKLKDVQETKTTVEADLTVESVLSSLGI